LRSPLLNSGGDSNASSSSVLNIFILAMGRTHTIKIERVHKPLFLLHRGLRAKSSKTPQNMLQNYGAKGMVQKYTPFLVFAP
jgi:hypothetical protein